MAVQQIPELLPVKGVQYVGPLPEELQLYTVFAAGVAVLPRIAPLPSLRRCSRDAGRCSSF
jgi:molybdate transport system substrate-binding protein